VRYRRFATSFAHCLTCRFARVHSEEISVFRFDATTASVPIFNLTVRKDLNMSFDCKKWLETVENVGPTKVSQFPEEAADWLAIRQREALNINPATAEVYWDYGSSFDPYYLYPSMPQWALDIDDRDDGYCDDAQCEEPLCSYRTILLVRDPASEIVVHSGDLPAEGIDAILSRELKVHFIREIGVPIRPLRYHRRCATVRGSLTVNHDISGVIAPPPVKGREWRAMARPVAAEIHPKTADVCRLWRRCDPCGDPYSEDHVLLDEPREFFFYRDPRSRIWVPETYIAQELNDKMKRRIKRKRIDVLWMDQCDD
jgi:hypothetical protein